MLMNLLDKPFVDITEYEYVVKMDPLETYVGYNISPCDSSRLYNIYQEVKNLAKYSKDERNILKEMFIHSMFGLYDTILKVNQFYNPNISHATFVTDPKIERPGRSTVCCERIVYLPKTWQSTVIEPIIMSAKSGTSAFFYRNVCNGFMSEKLVEIKENVRNMRIREKIYKPDYIIEYFRLRAQSDAQAQAHAKLHNLSIFNELGAMSDGHWNPPYQHWNYLGYMAFIFGYFKQQCFDVVPHDEKPIAAKMDEISDLKFISEKVKARVWDRYYGDLGATMCPFCINKIKMNSFECSVIDGDDELHSDNLRPVCSVCVRRMYGKSWNDYCRQTGTLSALI